MKHPGAGTDQTPSAAFKRACLAEIEALKPGNVHIFADGHGMAVQDFVLSAEAAGEVIAQSGASIGQRIHAAVYATWAAVGCNTNLGIVLLCAPLLHAREAFAGDLRHSLQQSLAGLTITDAQLAFQAIARAAPAGLGDSSQHDVHAVPTVTLLQAMCAAAERDLVARQYANGYHEVFNIGLPEYRSALSRWQRPAWAVTLLYLKFLASFPDTHLMRKFGPGPALEVQAEALVHYQRLLAMDNPKLYQRELLAWDKALKSRGLNPGTSADLTVATLLACSLEDLLSGGGETAPGAGGRPPSVV